MSWCEHMQANRDWWDRHGGPGAVYDYDPATGIFTHKVGATQPHLEGKRAGSTNKRGYRMIAKRLSGSFARLSEHVAAYRIMMGRWPAEGMVVDHKNGDTLDNRWSNLREVTNGFNIQRGKEYTGASIRDTVSGGLPMRIARVATTVACEATAQRLQDELTQKLADAGLLRKRPTFPKVRACGRGWYVAVKVGTMRLGDPAEVARVEEAFLMIQDFYNEKPELGAWRSLDPE